MELPYFVLYTDTRSKHIAQTFDAVLLILKSRADLRDISNPA
jgi:hypothetical protein